MARKMSKKARAAALRNLAKARRARKKSAPVSKKRRRAKSSKRRARRSKALKASGRIRPVVIVSGGKYHRPKKSKYFRGPTRINPRRRRRYRRNPVFGLPKLTRLFSVKTFTRYAAIGGGMLAGTMFSRFLNTGMVPFLNTVALPAAVTDVLSKARPIHGFAHIALGWAIQTKARNPIMKDVGVGLAALGGFDLLMQVLTLAGVKNLPTFSGMNVEMMGMNVDAGMPTVLAGNVDPHMEDGLINL